MLLAGGDKDDVVRTMHSPSEGQLADLCAKLRHLDLLVISEEIFTEILFDQVCNNPTLYYSIPHSILLYYTPHKINEG